MRQLNFVSHLPWPRETHAIRSGSTLFRTLPAHLHRSGITAPPRRSVHLPTNRPPVELISSPSISPPVPTAESDWLGTSAESPHPPPLQRLHELLASDPDTGKPDAVWYGYQAVLRQSLSSHLTLGDYRNLVQYYIQPMLRRNQHHRNKVVNEAQETKAKAAYIQSVATSLRVAQICDSWLNAALRYFRLREQGPPDADALDAFTFTDYQTLLRAYAMVNQPEKVWFAIGGIPLDALECPRPRPSNHLASLMNSYARSANESRGRKLWRYAIENDFDINLSLYNTYLRLLSRCGNFDAVQSVLGEYHRAIKVTGVAIHPEILAALQRREGAVMKHPGLLVDIVHYILDSPTYTINPLTYNLIINLLGRIRDLPLLTRLFDEGAVKRRYPSNTESWSAYLRAFTLCRSEHMVRRLIECIQTRFGATPTWHHALVMMRAYYEVRDPEAMFACYNRVKDTIPFEHLQSGDLRQCLNLLIRNNCPDEALAIYQQVMFIQREGYYRCHIVMINAARRLNLPELLGDISRVVEALGGMERTESLAALARAYGQLGNRLGLREANAELWTDSAQLSPQGYTDWLIGNAQGENAAQAKRIYDHLYQNRVHLTSGLFQALAQQAVDDRSRQRLDALFQDLLALPLYGLSGSCWDPALFNALMESFLAFDDMTVADRLISLLRRQPALRRAFTIEDFDRLMRLLGHKGLADHVWRILNVVLDEELPLSEQTYITLCKTLLGQPDKPDRLQAVVRSALRQLTPESPLNFVMILFVSLSHLRDLDTLERVFEQLIHRSLDGLAPDDQLDTCVNLFDPFWSKPDSTTTRLIDQYLSPPGGPRQPVGAPEPPAPLAGPITPPSLPDAVIMSPSMPDPPEHMAPITLFYAALLQGLGVLPYRIPGDSARVPTEDLQILAQLSPMAAPADLWSLLVSHPNPATLPQRVLFAVAALTHWERFDEALALCSLVCQHLNLDHDDLVVERFLPTPAFVPLLKGLATMPNLPLVAQTFLWMTRLDPNLPYRALAVSAISTHVRTGHYAWAVHLVEQVYHLDTAAPFRPDDGLFARFPTMAALLRGSAPPEPTGVLPESPAPSVALPDQPFRIPRAINLRVLEAYAHVDPRQLVPWTIRLLQEGHQLNPRMWVFILDKVRHPSQLDILLFLHTVGASTVNQSAAVKNDRPRPPPERSPHGTLLSRIQGRLAELRRRGDDQLKALVLPPSRHLPTPMLSCLMRNYDRMHYPQLGVQMWRQFMDEGIPPNQQVISVVLDMATPSTAYLIDSITEYSGHHGIVWNTNDYTSLIEAHCRLGRFNDAYRALTETMPRERVRPDAKLVTNFSTMLQQAMAENLTEEGGPAPPASVTARKLSHRLEDDSIPSLLAFIDNNPFSVSQKLEAYLKLHFPNLATVNQAKRMG